MTEKKVVAIKVKAFKDLMTSLGDKFEDYDLLINTGRYSDMPTEFSQVVIDMGKKTITIKEK